MKLEVGKHYLTEDGRIVKIKEFGVYQFLDEDDFIYDENGINGDYTRNLIAEIPKELHQYLIQTIKDYHTDSDFKATVDNVYGGLK